MLLALAFCLCLFICVCIGVWVARHVTTGKNNLHDNCNAQVTYADYAGTPVPFSFTELNDDSEAKVLGMPFANPHSDVSSDVLSSMPSSRASINALRQLTLQLCNAPEDEWVCIITSGATAAIKLAAESFPWTRGESIYLLLSDNHTSVVGVREIAAQHGAATGVVRKRFFPQEYSGSCVGVEKDELSNNHHHHQKMDATSTVHSMFAFPLESNFNGARYNPGCTVSSEVLQKDVTWVHPPQKDRMLRKMKQHRWHVLLDAARGCATQPPDLSKYPSVSFVALSYYKIIGYATGLGALLVRRDVLKILRRTYFGGGTVTGCVVDRPLFQLRDGPEAFEDGTLPFLTIPCAVRGLKRWLQAGGPMAAATDGRRCGARLAERLKGLTHYNGVPVCCLYGSNESHGMLVSIVAFNVRDSGGRWVGPRQVRRIAALERVFLRAGTLCNPGACADALGVDSETVAAWIRAGRDCDDEQSDVIDGQPTGVVRASFGLGSSLKDVERIIDVICRHFVEIKPTNQRNGIGCWCKNGKVLLGALQSPSLQEAPQPRQLSIDTLFIYPIKSAAPQMVTEWPLDAEGALLWDRKFAILDASGQPLTMRRCPLLLGIKPRVDLKRGVLTITGPSLRNERERVGSRKELVVVLESERGSEAECKKQWSWGGEWFTAVLGIKCMGLVKYDQLVTGGSLRSRNKGAQSFANQTQYLVISRPSLDVLYSYAHKTIKNLDVSSFADRFRPNIVIKGDLAPFEEDCWSNIRFIDKHHSVKQPKGISLTVVDSCKRCSSICLDPNQVDSTVVDTELLTCLARLRCDHGKLRLSFGVLAACEVAPFFTKAESVLKVGMGVEVCVDLGGGGNANDLILT